MPRYKLTLEYDGTGTVGWQAQEGCISLQALLENALVAYAGQRVEAVAAGRTDAGVHALGQVAHVDMPKPCDPYSLMQGINFHLYMQTGDSEETRSVPKLAVVACEAVGEDFHARFSATKRYYLYRMLNRRVRPILGAHRVWHVHEEMDIEAMQHAAKQLLGHHDFSSFRDAQCQAKSPLKTLDELRIEPQSNGEILFHLNARSFLHHQVRILVGTLRWVGNGKLKPSDIPAILEAKKREAAGPTAAAHGLYLTRVDYE